MSFKFDGFGDKLLVLLTLGLWILIQTIVFNAIFILKGLENNTKHVQF